MDFNNRDFGCNPTIVTVEDKQGCNYDDIDDNENGVPIEEPNLDNVDEDCIGKSDLDGYPCEIDDDLTEEDVKKMTFDNLNDAETFYNMYAKCVGFSIRRADLRTNKGTDFVSMRMWVCSKVGFRDKKWVDREVKQREPKALTRVGCQAKVWVRYDRKQKKFIATDFCREHNHSLPGEDSIPFIWSHRYVKRVDLAHTRSMQEVGWQTSDTMKFFAHQAGGYNNVGFILKDLYNHLDAERKLEIKDGDAIAAMAYLCAKKDRDPNFFFKYDVDDDNKLSRLFWCDSRSISDYKSFGDVLVFDTTYQTNAYRKPLVILAGVNNHYLTTIFSCALLSDETEDTYIWVLKTLLQVMEGKEPSAVITDSDNAMKNAIEKVFLMAQHRLCSWHILRNAATHVHFEHFCERLKKCMKANCTEIEFDCMWEKVVTECGVKDNSWVHKIFGKRYKWLMHT